MKVVSTATGWTGLRSQEEEEEEEGTLEPGLWVVPLQVSDFGVEERMGGEEATLSHELF